MSRSAVRNARLLRTRTLLVILRDRTEIRDDVEEQCRKERLRIKDMSISKLLPQLLVANLRLNWIKDLIHNDSNRLT
jgi:ribosomal protein S3AE